MSHFTRTQTTSTWTVSGAGGYVTLQNDWQSLADKVFKTVNGDKGGTWAPSSPIVVNSSGMLVSSQAVINFGGKLKTTSGARFVLGNGEYPKLSTSHVGRTRTIRQSLLDCQSSPRYHWGSAADYIGSIQTIACTIVTSSGLEQPKCAIPLRVHDGARMTSATLIFRIPTERTQIPKAMPRMRFIRVDKDGRIESLQSATQGTDVDGYSSQPLVKSGGEWFNNGEAQSWTVQFDQNHTIDTSLYMYYAQIIEEVGTDDPGFPLSKMDGIVVRQRKKNVSYAFTNSGVVPLGDPTVYGAPAAVVTGTVVLVLGNTGSSSQFNGIWIVDASGGLPGNSWTRMSGDLQAAEDFTPYFLVTCDGSIDTDDQWTSWECVSPVATSRITLSVGDDVGDPIWILGGPSTAFPHITFQRPVRRGNVYHSLTCIFDQISDMRPQ